MRLSAKLLVQPTKSHSDLVKAFFSSFDPENSIEIVGDRVKLEIEVKEDFKTEIFEALVKAYRIEELHYGKEAGKHNGRLRLKATIVDAEYEKKGSLLLGFFKVFDPEGSFEIDDESTEIQTEKIENAIGLAKALEVTGYSIVDELYYGKSIENHDGLKEEEPKAEIPSDEVKGEEPKADVPSDEVKEEEPKADVPSDELEKEEPKADVPSDEVKEEEPKAEILSDEVKGEEPKAEIPSDEVKEEEAVTKETVKTAEWKPEKPIAKFEKIAGEASSYEDFVKLLVDWLEVDSSKQLILKKLLIVLSEIEKISWMDIEEALKKKGVLLKSSDKLAINKALSRKLIRESMPPLKVFNVIAKYKDYPFTAKPKATVNKVVYKGYHEYDNGAKKQPEKKQEEKAKPEVNEQKARVEASPKGTMNCMPLIPEFEDALAQVDKTKSMEERAKSVLSVVKGFNKEPSEMQDKIVRFVLMDSKDAGFSVYNERMKLATLIAKYLQPYDETARVNMSDFTKQLKEVLM